MLFSSLSPQAFWLTAFFFAISPFLVYYITFTAFHRKAQSNASGKTPPTIPFCFPVGFHAFSLAIVGPQKYFAQALYVLRSIFGHAPTNRSQKGLWRV
jgi:hypothetical protein